MVDMEAKLRDMNELQIDVSLLSHGLPLGPDVLFGEEADEWAMRVNDELARIIQTYPGKFIGLGSLGFGDPQRAIAEVDRCITQLGLKGIQVFSTLAHQLLDSPEIRPVLKHLGRLGVPIHLHPAAPVNLHGLTNASLLLGLGFPYESSLNVVRLIQSGLFDEVPDLKMIVSHVGGVLPYLAGRLEVYTAPSPLTGPSHLPHPLGHYLRNLYVDTVSYHPAALACCYAVLGAQHLLYGTDHPFGRPDMTAEMVEQLACPSSERELIYHGNAERLFGLQG
jgi:predicted TIM-barrel fold metal-dependent hydrolase